MSLLTGSASSYAQFITVLIIFVLVLAATALVTKWIAGYQKKQGAAANMEIVETLRIANNRYLQLVRIGSKYVVIGVGKEEVFSVCEISGDELDLSGEERTAVSFRSLFERATLAAGSRKAAEDGDASPPHNVEAMESKLHEGNEEETI